MVLSPLVLLHPPGGRGSPRPGGQALGVLVPPGPALDRASSSALGSASESFSPLNPRSPSLSSPLALKLTKGCPSCRPLCLTVPWHGRQPVLSVGLLPVPGGPAPQFLWGWWSRPVCPAGVLPRFLLRASGLPLHGPWPLFPYLGEQESVAEASCQTELLSEFSGSGRCFIPVHPARPPRVPVGLLPSV